MKIVLSCSVHGEAFRPSEAEDAWGRTFDEKGEVGEAGVKGLYKGKPQPFGYGVIEVVIHGNCLSEALLTFLDRVKEGLTIWRQMGADDIDMRADVYYRDQCNLEITEATIAALSEIQLGISFSCYQGIV